MVLLEFVRLNTVIHSPEYGLYIPSCQVKTNAKCLKQCRYLEHNPSFDWLVAGVAVIGDIQVIIIQHDSSLLSRRGPVLLFTPILGKFSIHRRDVSILCGEIGIRVHLYEHCVAWGKYLHIISGKI